MCTGGQSIDDYLSINGPGEASLSFPSDDTPRVVDLTKTELANSSTSVKISWHYPKGSLTLKIATAFTKQQKPYAIRFDKDQLRAAITNVYQIVDDQETENANFVFNSDSNYQIVIKFRAASDRSPFIAFINYDIIPK